MSQFRERATVGIDVCYSKCQGDWTPFFCSILGLFGNRDVELTGELHKKVDFPLRKGKTEGGWPDCPSFLY